MKTEDMTQIFDLVQKYAILDSHVSACASNPLSHTYSVNLYLIEGCLEQEIAFHVLFIPICKLIKPSLFMC